MIDMSTLYEHDDYEIALERFHTSDCKWSSFVDVHIKVSKNRCPICESPLDGSVTRLSNSGNIVIIDATVDHYRPQKYYSFLKCTHENYLLMCSECNNIYKGSQFPLHSSTPIRATEEENIKDEKPLIVNPIYDDLLELFILVFRRSGEELLLELKAKSTTGYLYEKALETIRLFGLGDCEINRHQNESVYSCRINVLQSHFGVFYEFAKALNEGNREKALLELRANKDIFENYGFYEFIKRNQFVVSV